MRSSLFSQESKTNLHIGYLGEGYGLSIMIEQGMTDRNKSDLYFKVGAATLILDWDYSLPHSISWCKGEQKQFELGFGGVLSRSTEFWGSRRAFEYHIYPILGYRTYVKS